MPSFLFDLGNSSEGPIGLVARVQAADKAQALERLRSFLNGVLDDCHGIDLPPVEEDEGIEYARIYVTPENVTVADICDGEIEEDDEDVVEDDDSS